MVWGGSQGAFPLPSTYRIGLPLDIGRIVLFLFKAPSTWFLGHPLGRGHAFLCWIGSEVFGLKRPKGPSDLPIRQQALPIHGSPHPMKSVNGTICFRQIKDTRHLAPGVHRFAPSTPGLWVVEELGPTEASRFGPFSPEGPLPAISIGSNLGMDLPFGPGLTVRTRFV